MVNLLLSSAGDGDCKWQCKRLVPITRCCLRNALLIGGEHVPGSVLTATPTTSHSCSPHQDSITFLIKALYGGGGVGEMAQLVRALAALVEDLGQPPHGSSQLSVLQFQEI